MTSAVYSLWEGQGRRRDFTDLSEHELVKWLYEAGHQWADRFVEIYGVDLVAEVLSDVAGGPDDPRPVHVPALVRSVRYRYGMSNPLGPNHEDLER